MIANVECFVLLDPSYDKRATSSAQDDLVVRMHTDDGYMGIGEAGVHPWAEQALIESPGTIPWDLAFWLRSWPRLLYVVISVGRDSVAQRW